ncbi:MAG: hypothetical protein GXO86_07030 [Chlorobi bacterium]|nr:hypothetical protein [Chlorobiota bacterium]
MLKYTQYGNNLVRRLLHYFLFLFIFIPAILSAQPFVIDSGINITRSPGNDLFAKWSPDGKKLLYQSDRNGNWDIYMLDFETDTSVQLTSSPEDEQHPVWFERGRKVVFDCDYGEGIRLYVLDTISKQVKLLFNRDIQARQAAFANHDDLVFFSGFDKQQKTWKIYSYEFYYQNLNELNGDKGTCTFPAVSPKGDRVVFLFTRRGETKSKLMMINWYGININRFDEFDFHDPSFAANGNLIYFVSGKDNPQGEVYSMHKDGSHLEQLTNDEYIVRCPQVSPDGSKIALSVKTGDDFDIYIIPLEVF